MAKPGFFEYVADRLVSGAESELAARLTSEALRMLAEGVAEPDRYAVLARLCPQALSAVLAEAGPSVEREASAARASARAAEEEALDAEMGAGRPGVAAEISAGAKAGVEQIIRRQNVAMADDLARLWYRVAGKAVARTLQGDSRRAVMEDAVRALADKGLETVDYASRRRTSVDAATRRHMVTQASQARARLLVQRCDEHGVALVFTSAHYGARPSHAAWQGKAYGLHGPVTVGGVRYPGLAEATGYGGVAGLCGANCRHTFHPYSPGGTRLPDTRFEAEEDAFGQTSDERYAALQRQRELERRVRKYKRRVAMGQESGLDMAADRARLGRAQAEVRAWCKANGLPRRYDLERAYGVREQPRALRETPEQRAKRQIAELKAAGKAHVHEAAQNKHVPGTKEFEDKRRSLEAKAMKTGAAAYPSQSYFTGTPEEVCRMVERAVGTGEPLIGRDGRWTGRELVDIGRGIGFVVDVDGTETPTGSITIHYSKRGVHGVPRRAE